MRPALAHRQFRLPRRGHPLEECQDASAADPARGRFAVADGATESDQGGAWARLLVEEFVRSTDPAPDWAAWLSPLRERWAASSERPSEDAPLPWYLDVRWRQGAFATFLGLVVEDQTWHAVAVGDSCLFQVRDGNLLTAFPLSRSAEFGNAPWLVGSRTRFPERPGEERRSDCQPGDRLWLMTDALAQWFVSEVEAGGKPWDLLESLLQAPDEAFAENVENLRAAQRLRNDDVTVIAVCV
jgi:hypothetical protein